MVPLGDEGDAYALVALRMVQQLSRFYLIVLGLLYLAS